MACHLLQNDSLQWAIAILKPTWFLQNRLAQPSQFCHWTDSSIALQFDSLNRTDSGFFLQNRVGFFKLVFFCTIKQGACQQPAIVSCKRTRSFVHARLYHTKIVAHNMYTDISSSANVSVMCYYLGVITFSVVLHDKITCPFAGNYSQLWACTLLIMKKN